MTAKPQRKKKLDDQMLQENKELDQLVSKLIADYKAANGTQHEAHPHVLQMCDSDERTGAYNVEEQNETAEILLHQLSKKIKEEKPEQERLEVEEPPLLVLAKRVRTFTTYFCGMKKDRPVWSYQEFLGARFNFAEAEKMVTTLGDGVFAMPALERRAVANRSSW